MDLKTTLLFLIWNVIHSSLAEITPLPRFVGPIQNVTVPVGREAAITCTVDNLGSYKVAWVQVYSQTILTIHNHVITRSHRINLSHTDSWTWTLHIKNVREEDRGLYMCQINTDPMMAITGYLQVVVPPDILDYPTSTDMVVREGTNVTLQCSATGFPQPKIVWRREDKQKISFEDNLIEGKEGPIFNITRVNRLHMGTYLCIASNGVPPSFPPMIMVPQQLIGAALGQDVVLECHSEAYPRSINYWKRDNGETIVPVTTIEGDKYEPTYLDNVYKVTMRLTIRGVSESDYGSYICLSKNSLGETDGHIKLYPITLPSTSTVSKTTILPSPSNNFNSTEKGGNRRLQLSVTNSKGKTSPVNNNSNSRFSSTRKDFSENTFKSIRNTQNEVFNEDTDEASGAPVSPHMTVQSCLLIMIFVMLA